MSDDRQKTRHRFLSPHYDDIALSCGGTVAKLAHDGCQPEICVLFGDGPAPGAKLTPLAAENLRDWGLSAADVILARREEEQHAARLLGATATWLPYPDAIYRDARYVNDEQLFGEPDPAESELPETLFADVVPEAGERSISRFYAPLAVGGHVDHRHAFRIGIVLARAGLDVWFFEDLPYALRPGLLHERIEGAGVPLVPAATVPIATVWETKLAAILAYPSQLARTFSFAGVGGRAAEIDAVLHAYAAEVGNGTLAERFWRLDGATVPGESQLVKASLINPEEGY